jgi:hypothetical protein
MGSSEEAAEIAGAPFASKCTEVLCRSQTYGLMPVDERHAAAFPALRIGRCAPNRSVLWNGESSRRVRSCVAAGSQAGVKRATNWAIRAVGVNTGLVCRWIGNSLLNLVVAGVAVVQPFLLCGLIVARPAHGGRRCGGATTDQRRARQDQAQMQRSKHSPDLLRWISRSRLERRTAVAQE